MATIKLDVIRNSRYRSERGQVRIVRGAVVYDIDTSAPQNVLIAAIRATPRCPQEGEPHPAWPVATCIGHEIQRFNSDSSVDLGVIYETPKGNPTGSPVDHFQVRYSSTLVNVKTNKSPITMRPIRVKYTDTSNNNFNKIVPVNYQRPIRVLTGSGVFSRPITEQQVATALGRVNASPWNGYQKGFWLCSAIDEDTADGGRTWSVSISFLNNVVEDWSSWAVMLDENGDPVYITDSDVSDLQQADYDVITHQRSGVTKVGLYDLADFAAQFPLITSTNQLQQPTT